MAGPSLFCDVPQAPPVAVFQLTEDYKADNSPKKINLGVGAYRTDEGKPWVLPVVKSVEAQMAVDPLLDHEYLPVLGLPSFCSAATELALGKDSVALLENRAGGVQTLSGTGSLRLGAEFLKRFYNKKEASTPVYVSDPTWGNQLTIYKAAGFSDIRKYRYWNAKDLCLDLEGMLEDLGNAPTNSIVLFHSCAHNPTGCDPTTDQWEKISQVCKARSIFPVFDTAYQGFATGDPDADAWACRYFVKQGFELIACQSFAKNFGLYNERCGNLALVMKDPATLTKVRSQITLIVRHMYSNPPHHGARIVATVLNNPALRQEWFKSIAVMSGRIREMRQAVFDKLRAKGTPGTWGHVVKQIGMFSFTGLNPKQVEFLKTKHIFMMGNGRINIAALNTSNVDYFCDCVHEAVTSTELGKL